MIIRALEKKIVLIASGAQDPYRVVWCMLEVPEVGVKLLGLQDLRWCRLNLVFVIPH